MTTPLLLSWGTVDPVDSAARGPVISAFLVFIGLCLLWVFTLATQDDHPERLYVADRSLSPVFNGFALAGEHITVVTLFAAPGAVALFGYDGFASVIADSVIALGVLLLLAQKIRDSGRYTLGGLFSLRASGPGTRTAAVVVTLVITLPLLMVQLRAAGISAALLIGMSSPAAQVACTVLMGCLITCFAAVADLRGTTFVQVVKVPVTLLTLAVVTLLALSTFSWSPGDLLSTAAEQSTAPERYLSPGLWAHTVGLGPMNTISDHIVVILGTAMMPHLVLRIAASRSGRSARRSTSLSVGLAGAFYILLATTGFAAAAVVGSREIGAVDANGQGAAILLASDVIGRASTSRVVLITLVACVAFLAVLTAVTSVTFAASVALTHDVLTRTRRSLTEAGEIRAVRFSVVLLCIGGMVLSAVFHRYPVEFLVTFSLGVGATCVFPVLVYSFFWPRFNRRGLLWCVYGGLFVCIVLTAFSPTVSGTDYALLPKADFSWYPFHTSGAISVPAAFLLGWLGSTRSPGGAVSKSQLVDSVKA
ncbi:transporter [Streptomyces sp. TLI_105]|uniref:sodium:solute symporter family transporter n=1 Tax=Streptomyces sp. TLI_105 TaxID=1881019 RepID=UPI0008977C24|nr:transporter [Streptomyces sp. TLI_105]SEB82780.1 cation/acetate symporter [Streptomyces sp. TLI_105]